MLLLLVQLINTFLIFSDEQANKVTLIMMQISAFSSAIQQYMDSENLRATTIVIPVLIVTY